jgi:hypothetical protein
MTNYERIKNMSVEEMAEFLEENNDICCFCVLKDNDVCNDEDCKYFIKQWLGTEVEE